MKYFSYKLNRFVCKLVLLVAFSGSVAFAEESDPFGVQKDAPKEPESQKSIDAYELTLSDFIELAILNNPSLRQSYLQAKITAAQHGRSLSAYLPNVDASGSGSRSGEKWDTSDGVYSTGAAANLSLDWLLLDFGARSANTERTKQALIAANFNYDATLRNTVFSVVNAYFSLFSAQSDVQSSIANEESAKMAYDVASKRHDLEQVSLGDKLQAETSYVQAQLDTTRARNNLELMKGNLAALVNKPPQEDISLAENPYNEKDAQFEGRVEDLMKAAIEQRPEVLARRAEVESSAAELRAVEKEDNLRISLNSSAGINDGISPNTENLYNGSIGLRFTIPIFTGYDHTYSVMQSRYRLENTKASLSQTENDVRIDVWKSFQQYKTAVKAFEISQRLFASAEENEKIAMGAYKAGKLDIVNLLNAQSLLMSARREKSASLYNLLIAKSDLLRSLGKMGNLK